MEAPLVLAKTLERMIEIFRGMGFSVADGPEVESPHYNFTALNIPEGHPTRDEHDSFFISDDLLLRTQTSPVQHAPASGHTKSPHVCSARSTQLSSQPKSQQNVSTLHTALQHPVCSHPRPPCGAQQSPVASSQTGFGGTQSGQLIVSVPVPGVVESSQDPTRTR